MEEQKKTVTGPVIRVVNCCYSYDSKNNSLEDINLSIPENDFAAIIGQNGCGKSTLLKNICGLLRPSSGEIFINGKNSKNFSVSAISREIGFVMQNPDSQLFTDTVYKEVSFALRNIYKNDLSLNEAEIRLRTEQALAAVGLAGQKNAFPLALSRGDRKKTVIAAVLAMGCKTIILDEPDANQDNYGCRLIMDTVRGLNKQGYTIIFVTHNMSLAAEYAHRLIVMGANKIRMDGTPAEIFYRVDELAQLRIVPPQIVGLCLGLQKELKQQFKLDVLDAAQLGEALLRSKKS